MYEVKEMLGVVGRGPHYHKRKDKKVYTSIPSLEKIVKKISLNRTMTGSEVTPYTTHEPRCILCMCVIAN